jgi:glutathionyl-hydroquinone reductase
MNDFLQQHGFSCATRASRPSTSRELGKAVHAARELGPVALCKGVYRCGFARSQSAYNAAVRNVLVCLRSAEARLAQPESGGFLVGGRLTEADVQLF